MFGDILLADEGTVGNKYGIVRSKEGIVYVRGRLELGDSVSTNAADLTDVDRTVVFENPVYYNGSSVASCITSTLYRIDFVGNATGSTTVQFGKKVGTGDTARGRNGLTIFSADPNVTIDFDTGSADNVKIYGSTFRQIKGGISWGANTAHEFVGSTIDQSAQFDPIGGVQIRNCVFSGHNGTDAALLWNADIDIKNCSFLASSDATNDPAGIEHPATGTFTYVGLSFSGNDYDIYNSSGGAVTINASGGSNPTTHRTPSGSTTINNNIAVTLTGMKDNTEVRVYAQGTTTELAGIENATSGTQDNRSFTFSLAASTVVDIRIHSVAYEALAILSFAIPASDSSIPISQRFDRSYSNP
jgi:hypothetical protein